MTKPHDGLPVLDLECGRKMTKQTYLDMDQYFLIEAECLELWSDSQLQLSSASLAVLHGRLRAFTLGRVRRASGKLSPRSPIDYHGVLPHLLGLNDSHAPARLAGPEPPNFKKAPRANCALTIKRPDGAMVPMVAAG